MNIGVSVAIDALAYHTKVVRRTVAIRIDESLKLPADVSEGWIGARRKEARFGCEDRRRDNQRRKRG